MDRTWTSLFQTGQVKSGLINQICYTWLGPACFVLKQVWLDPSKFGLGLACIQP